MNYTYRNFQKQDFHKVLDIFLKFQEQAKIETFYNLTKDQNPGFGKLFLIEEFKKILKKSKTYVGLADGEIFGFACFSESSIQSDAIDLQIVCKDPKINFNFKMKKLVLDGFIQVKKDFNRKSIICALGPRYKFDSYKNFVIRIFKPSIIRRNQMKKMIIKFND